MSSPTFLIFAGDVAASRAISVSDKVINHSI
jgi:hypothetical protein